MAHAPYRLPRHARPRRYELRLTPDLDAATFAGDVSIDVEVLEPCDHLVLHAADLDVSAAKLRAGDQVLAAEVSLDPELQQLRLALPRPVEAGSYRLDIGFEGVLNDQLRGFYRSTFTDQSGRERVIATTQFEASDARRAFPCWDEPDFKATFRIRLVVDPDLTGISNAPLESRVERDDGKVELCFAESMVMSTYIVAFVVGPYELTEPAEAAGVPVRVAAVPAKLHLSAYALDAAIHAVEFLSRYFGIPYPGEKLDHVAVPDFAFGAMENLGCVTYRESLLLADPATAAQNELQRIATVVAHETAHMWFGDLVTMKWWNGIWLNEAFATFMELTTTEAYRPEWEVWTGFGAGKAAAMSTDGLRATRSVEFPVGRPEEAEAMFDVLTYQKGGSVLRMLEQYLGPETFRKGISHYLATHAHGNTESSDLWDAIEAVSGEPVRQIMTSWIHQGGYPMISVGLDGSDPSVVKLSQRRFLSDGSDSPETWAVPVNLRASVNGQVQRERLLLDSESGSFSFAGPVDWVVVNDGAWGFYRTRYSTELWQRLSSAGPLKVLGPLERLQLVGDIWAALSAGQADLGDWAEIALAVAGEPDPDVWGALAGQLHLLDLLAADADRPALESFARRLARPTWERLGWEPEAGEGNRTAIARSRVLSALASTGRDPEMLAGAARLLDDHLAGRSVPPDLVAASARIAVADGSADTWTRVREAYNSADNPQDQQRYLYALTETSERDLRVATMEMAAGPEVRAQDGPMVIAGVLGQPGQAEPWSWVEENWDRLQARFPSSLLIRILEPAVAFVDEDAAAAVRAFCERTDLPFSHIRADQILERMSVTVRLAGRLRSNLAAGLD
jgi:puromycin-sensitive aminopeptidase